MAETSKTKRKVQIEVIFKEDGVYLSVTNPYPDKPVLITDINRVIEEKGIVDVDFAAISNIIKSKAEHNEVLISGTAKTVAVDEAVKIEITADKMQVRAKFTPPKAGGKKLTVQDVVNEITAKEVTYGIREDVIKKVLSVKDYSKTYIVGIGKPPVNAVDGKLEFTFDTEIGSHKPKVLPDGSVDFHNLNLYKVARKGEVLCTAIQYVEGTDGINVFGNPVPHIKGKKTPKLPKGKNVSADPENTKLISDIDGQLCYANGKISIFPLLEISTDVGTATGNIDFNGSVNIQGNVLTGFRVIASGDVNIYGAIEGAHIQCGGNIYCKSGIDGVGKAEIVALGNIATQYIRSCIVEARGNIVTSAIMHSKIKCYGKIDVSSGKGIIAGGKLSVLESIEVKVMGSKMGTATEISVGVMDETVEAYNSAIESFKESNEKYKLVNEEIKKMLTDSKRIALTTDKKAILGNYAKIRDELKVEIEKLQATIDELLPEMRRNSGFVKLYDIAYAGISLRIGNAGIIIKDDIRHARLYNDKSRVAIGIM